MLSGMFAEWGHRYMDLEIGDCIVYKEKTERHHIVDIIDTAGKEGRGGMDQGSPSTRTIIFESGHEVKWDPWRGIEDYTPFHLIAIHAPKQSRRTTLPGAFATDK